MLKALNPKQKTVAKSEFDLIRLKKLKNIFFISNIFFEDPFLFSFC